MSRRIRQNVRFWARQQRHGGSTTRTKSRPQHGSARDSAQVFWHHQPGKESSVVVQEITLRTSHNKHDLSQTMRHNPSKTMRFFILLGN
ncbi:MAG: hypothetical protein ACK4HF_11110 [Paracoccaceae bacterium]